MYTYSGMVTRVIDGDTVEVVIDLGFMIQYAITVRLNNIDCPETRTKNLLEKDHGLKAKEFVINQLLYSQPVTIKTYSNKANIYARWTADIFYTFDGVEYSIVERLKEFGFEKKFNYEIGD